MSRSNADLRSRVLGDGALARNIALALLTVSLGWAVWTWGGVNPRQWEWSALGISVAACIVIAAGFMRGTSLKSDAGIILLTLLLGWMLLQIVPLPPAWVAH